MFESIAALVNRRGWAIMAGWLVFAALLSWRAPAWDAVTRDDDVRFFPPGSDSVVAQGLLERGFPRQVAGSSVVLVAERPDGKLTAEDFSYVDQLAARLRDLGEKHKELGIKTVYDHRTPVIGPRLIGTRTDGAGQAVVTAAQLQGTYVSKRARIAVDEIQKLLKGLPPPPEGLRLGITGSAAVGHDANQASADSIAATTNTTITLVVVILLVIYRSPLLALIPLATIALSVWASLKAIALLATIPGLNFQVINITNVFVIVVLFGAGTDYCLFLIARYREELAHGLGRREALSRAITQVGGALVASAGTVIVGLSMLWFSTFAKIQYTGPAIALSLAISLVASLTLAPVLLYWLRGAVFWPFRPPHHEEGADREAEGLGQSLMSGFWTSVADRIIQRPGTILAASLLALLPLAIFGAQTTSSYDHLADLPDQAPSVLGARMFQRYFPVGEIGPSTILVRHPDLDFRSAEGRQAIAALCRKLAAVPAVAEVRSLTQPLGKPQAEPAPSQPKAEPEPESPSPAPPAGPFGSFGALGRALQQTFRSPDLRQKFEEFKQQAIQAEIDRHYVSTDAPGPDKGHIAKIDVVLKINPFSAQAVETLRQIRQLVEEETQPGGLLAGANRAIGIGGITAAVSDLMRVTGSDERRMYVLVTLGVYAILVVLLRRPGICLYLIVTVILGYLASLGLTDLVFRNLHYGPDPWAGLDWKVGFFLFVILVAVGEDYNIFLMTRVIEEEHKHGPIEGTRRAVAHTGGIISSCGLIMAGTFGSMLTGSLMALQELGFALGLGVLLDTFVVRPILVPAFIILYHRLFPSARFDSITAHHNRIELPDEPKVAVPNRSEAGPNGNGATPRSTSVWSAPRFKDGWH